MDVILKNKKIILALLITLGSFTQTVSATTLQNKLDNLIKASNLSKSSIVSVSIRDTKNDQTYYDHFGNYLLKTASTLKAFTTAFVLDTFGANGEINTELFKSTKNNDVLIKLSGDPYFTSNDLKTLLLPLKGHTVKHILLDASIFDNNSWGIGWMWDDQDSELFPRFSPYNIDNNCITVIARPTSYKQPPSITIQPASKIKIINKSQTSSKINDFTISKQILDNISVLVTEGNISKIITKKIPAADTKTNFIEKLNAIIKINKINVEDKIITGKLDNSYTIISKISNKSLEEISKTNKYSNNFAAESLFKIASAIKSGKEGSTTIGIKYFKEFYQKINAPFLDQDIVDASGASHNNLLKTNWMTLALSKLYKQKNFEIYKSTLAAPGKEGTLSNRLLNLKNRFWGKTGTLAGISGLTGYLKTDSGKMLTIAILIQNFKGSQASAKLLENQIIEIASKY